MNGNLSRGCWETGGKTTLQEQSLNDQSLSEPLALPSGEPQRCGAEGIGGDRIPGKAGCIPERRDTSGEGVAGAGATGQRQERPPAREGGDGHSTGWGWVRLGDAAPAQPGAKSLAPPAAPPPVPPPSPLSGPGLAPLRLPPAAEPRYWLLPARRRRPPSPGPGRGRGVRAHGSAYKGAAPQPPGSFWSRATGAAGRGVSPGEHGSGGERRPPCMARDYERR